MIRVVVMFFFALCVSFIQAQQSIQWSELVRTKGSVAQLFPVSGADFYSIHWHGGAMSTTSIMKHTGFIGTHSGKIHSYVGKSIATIEGITAVNDKIVVFLSDKIAGKNKVYLQTYGSDCKPEGEAVEIASFDLLTTWKRKPTFNITCSQNKEFVCVEYDIPGSKSEKQQIGYSVFTDSLELVSHGNYELPFEAFQVEISNRYLSNTGDYFIACKIYNTEERVILKDQTTLEKAIVMQITPDGIEEFDLDFDGKKIYDIGFSSDNNRIMTFTGLYGDAGKGNTGIKGIFYFRLNFDSKEVIDEGFEPFSKSFITEGWSTKEKEKADKREANGKSAPQLYNYDIRETITLPDGSMIGTLEEYFVQQVSTNDYRTNSITTNYYYYYNNLIIYKIQPNGTFAWVKNIPKYQLSVNDGGYFSSIGRYLDKDQLLIYFNDNVRNYDENGQWNTEVYSTSFRKKTSVVAQVKIDLNTGGMQRQNFFHENEHTSIAVPKLFTTDYENQQMLMYFMIGRKEKFGLIDFKKR